MFSVDCVLLTLAFQAWHLYFIESLYRMVIKGIILTFSKDSFRTKYLGLVIFGRTE